MTAALRTNDYRHRVAFFADLPAADRATALWEATQDALACRDYDRLIQLREEAARRRDSLGRKRTPAALDAATLVRRIERAVGQAVLRGQALGEIRTTARSAENRALPSAMEFWKSGSDEGAACRAFARLSDDEWEALLAAGRRDGNLGRRNLMWMLRASKTPTGKSERIKELADAGHSSAQISERLGLTPEWVRELARRAHIDIPADDGVARRRRPDATRIARETAHALEGLAMGVELADVAALSPAEAKQCAASLNGSLRVLGRFARRLSKREDTP